MDKNSIRLKSRLISPPGGWRFEEKQSKLLLFGDSFDDLFNKVKSHREYKGYDLHDIDIDIEKYLCSMLNYDPNWCIKY